MKEIKVSDAVYDALKQLTSDFQQTPNDVLAALLHVPERNAPPNDPVVALVLSPEFRAKFTDADKYLALLGWIAERHRSEFREFIVSLGSGRRYLSLDRDEILAQCRHNQARQIPGTPFWAIMNLDTPTKRRFLSRVLEFCGYPEASIDLACAAIGMRRPQRRFALLAGA